MDQLTFRKVTTTGKSCRSVGLGGANSSNCFRTTGQARQRPHRSEIHRPRSSSRRLSGPIERVAAISRTSAVILAEHALRSVSPGYAISYPRRAIFAFGDSRTRAWSVGNATERRTAKLYGGVNPCVSQSRQATHIVRSVVSATGRMASTSSVVRCVNGPAIGVVGACSSQSLTRDSQELQEEASSSERPSFVARTAWASREKGNARTSSRNCVRSGLRGGERNLNADEGRRPKWVA